MEKGIFRPAGYLIGERQRGAVLIVALVLLLVLTILGVAGVQNTTMEERMTGNYRDRFSAFQAAEAALRAGEIEVSVSTTHNWDGTDGTYTVGTTTTSVDPLVYANYVSVVTTQLSGISANPKFLLERLPKVRGAGETGSTGRNASASARYVQFYRVSGRATGVSGKSEVVLQSTYYP